MPSVKIMWRGILVVQWLGLHASTGEVMDSTPVQGTKIMRFGPITSWQIDGETMETVRDFILGGSQNHLITLGPQPCLTH